MSASRKRLRTYKNCQACRERHTKCDDGDPACRSCVENDIECIRRIDIRFHSSSSRIADNFPPDQTWLPQPSHLKYRDETMRTVKQNENSMQNWILSRETTS